MYVRFGFGSVRSTAYASNRRSSKFSTCSVSSGGNCGCAAPSDRLLVPTVVVPSDWMVLPWTLLSAWAVTLRAGDRRDPELDRGKLSLCAPDDDSNCGRPGGWRVTASTLALRSASLTAGCLLRFAAANGLWKGLWNGVVAARPGAVPFATAVSAPFAAEIGADVAADGAGRLFSVAGPETAAMGGALSFSSVCPSACPSARGCGGAAAGDGAGKAAYLRTSFSRACFVLPALSCTGVPCCASCWAATAGCALAATSCDGLPPSSCSAGVCTT